MIRHAGLDDIGACLDVCEKASEESENYGKFHRGIAERNLRVRILNPYSLVLINEKSDGVLIGLATPSTHTVQIRVSNEFLYAQSEGVALIRAYLRWAKEWGDADINFCVSFGGEKGERASRLLKKLGLTEIGKLHRVI